RATVRVHGVPVREILEEIARQGGADIRGEVRRPRAVSVEFEDILLTDALGRLLGEQNFTLTYDDTGGLRAVELLGGPEAAVAKHDENAPGAKAGDKKWKWPPTEEARHALENLETFARRPDPIRVTGRLADALGTKTPTVGQLIEASSHHEDPRVQERAIIMVLRTLESDPQTRSALVTASDAFEDQGLVEFADDGETYAITVKDAVGQHVVVGSKNEPSHEGCTMLQFAPHSQRLFYWIGDRVDGRRQLAIVAAGQTIPANVRQPERI